MGLRRHRGDGHQSPHLHMGQGPGHLRRSVDLIRGKAAFGGLAADVHLQQDILAELQSSGGLFDLLQKLRAAHRLDQIGLAHHLADLVALQMADKVQGTAGVGVFRQLGGHLLDPVFAQGVNTGGNGLLAGGGVVHFAGAHQDDVGAGAAGLPGRLVHLLPDGGNVLRNRHSESLPFPY